MEKKNRAGTLWKHVFLNLSLAMFLLSQITFRNYSIDYYKLRKEEEIIRLLRV